MVRCPPCVRSLLLAAILATALARPAPALAAEEAPPPAGDRPVRTYLGLGLGTGGAELTTQGDSLGQAGLHLGRRPPTVRLGLEAGVVVRPGLRLGLDLAQQRSQTAQGGVHTSARFTDVGPVLTWSPWPEGLLVRVGGGLSFLTWDLDTFGRTSFSGLAARVGLGWAFRLDEAIELTANLDVAVHDYGSSPVGRDAATTWGAWLGACFY